MSLRNRLIAGLLFVVLTMLVVSTVVTVTTRANLIQQLDARLRVASRRTGEFERGGPRPSPNSNDLDDHPEPSDRLSDVYEGVIDADGELVTIYEPNFGEGATGSPSIDVERLLEAGGDRHDTIFDARSSNQDGRYRVYTRPALTGLIAVTALPMDSVDDAVVRLLATQAFGTLAIFAALAVVAWWMIRLGIQPINRMASKARQIADGDGDLSLRVPEGSPNTESGQLADALNTMLDRLQESSDERARSAERLRQFVADASHELRTPVTTIRGYSELYNMGALPPGDGLDDAMRRTHEEAQRMGRLVEDLLNLAKLDEHRPMNRSTVDVAELVRDAAHDAQATAPKRPIVVDAGGPAYVNGDEDRIRQVLANTLGNALIHTPTSARITLRCVTEADQVVVQIADEGGGMDPETAARITERFYRADKARTRDTGGSGLGMSIVDGIVAAHDGRLSVRSELGKGTTVEVRFPRHSAGILS